MSGYNFSKLSRSLGKRFCFLNEISSENGKYFRIAGLLFWAAVFQLPAAAREIQSLDFNWRFQRGDPANAELSELDDTHWRELDVPHDWSIEGPFDKDNPSGARGAYLPGGIGWYRKHFKLPASSRGKKVLIQFDGVYWQSKVWINGKLLGFRPSGYVSFYYDLTDDLNFGDAENVLSVRVDNSILPSERWYTGSGIYRHTWLIIKDPVHINHWDTYVVAEMTEVEKAKVTVTTGITNDTDAKQRVTLTRIVTDPSGREIIRKTSTKTLPARKRQTFAQQWNVGSPLLWSPDNPNLYTLKELVTVNGDIVDNSVTRFGIRTIQFDPDQGLFVNGRPTLIKGMCLHDDLGPLGSKFVDKSLERRLHMLKEMGCNAIRTAHNPPAPQLLDMCDEIGLLVVAEAFDKWANPPGPLLDSTGYHTYFNDWHERDLRDFLRRDRNHPSIIMWGLGNEIGEQGLENGPDIARRLKAITREEDPTRPVTVGLNRIQAANKYGLAEVFDVVGFNGLSLKYYEENHQRYPERKLYGSEIPHARDTRGVYKTTSYIPKADEVPEYNVPNLAPVEVFPEFPEQYRSSYANAFIRISALDSWRLVESRPYVAGEFRWTGFDYLGEADYAGGWPARSGDKGVFDLCGFKKDIYYFYKSRWTKEPVTHIFPHWTWPGKEGKTIPVWCYTNCDSVELIQDGRSLGRKYLDPSGSYYLSWDVEYRPGVLQAIGRNNNVEVTEQIVATADNPKRLFVTVDREKIRADGKEVAHVSVRVVDRYGNLVPHADPTVRFTIRGPGQIIGIGNGDILSHHDFQGTQVNAFHGMCSAIIQTKRNDSGEIMVEANATGLDSSPITILSY